MFVLLASILTYEQTPQAVLNDVMERLEDKVKIPSLWNVHIESKNLRPGLYGISLSMNAYARNIHILVDNKVWKSLTQNQRRILCFHEACHSIWNIKHCYDNLCGIRYGGRGHVLTKDIPFDSVVDYTLRHHYNEINGYPRLNIRYYEDNNKGGTTGSDDSPRILPVDLHEVVVNPNVK